MQTKRCPSCEQEKSVAEFAKHGRSRDGLNWQCRACHSLRMKRRSVENIARNSLVDERPTEKRCPDCGQVKAGREFASNVAQSDGLNVVCRPCDGERQKKRRMKYRAQKSAPTPESKVCGHCRNEKPASEFSKNGASKDGLRAVCNVCADASQRETVKRYRAVNATRDPRADTPEKQCPKCLLVKPSSEFGLNRSAHDGLAYECATCKKHRNDEWADKNRARVLWLAAKRRASQEGHAFTIQPSDIDIPDVCPVLGIEWKKGDRERSMSLDKIIPEKGYVPGNVVVLSMRANRLKSDATLEELRKLVAFFEKFNFLKGI